MTSSGQGAQLLKPEVTSSLQTWQSTLKNLRQKFYIWQVTIKWQKLVYEHIGDGSIPIRIKPNIYKLELFVGYKWLSSPGYATTLQGSTCSIAAEIVITYDGRNIKLKGW